MTDLSDFKQLVYEPEVAALKRQAANRSAIIVRLERVIDTLQARIAILERELAEARAKHGLVGSAGSDRDPDTSGASPEGNDGGQALPTSLADALEDLADARASVEAARAMRDRHEERYEKHKARADRYEKTLREIVNTLGPNHFSGELRGLLVEGNEALRAARAALAGEDAAR